MTDSLDYRHFLENEFSHIRGELSEIKKQVTLTNGTVREHEKYVVYADGIIAAGINEKNGIKTKLGELDTDVKCLGKIVDGIVNEKEVKKFINKSWWDKYSKVIETIGVVIAFLTIFAMVFSDSKRMDRIENKVDYLGSPIEFRGGMYNPFVEDTVSHVRLIDTMDYDRMMAKIK